MPIPTLKFIPEHFVNKTTVLYGQTNSGKSTLLEGVLEAINREVTQVTCFCGNDDNVQLYKKHIKQVFLQSKVHEDNLDRILEMQSALSTFYNCGNDPDLLENLYHRIGSQRLESILVNINRKERYDKELINTQYKKDPSIAENKRFELQKTYAKARRALFKKCILENRYLLKDQELSEEERRCLENIDLNPNLLVIMDDCQEELEEFKTSKRGKSFKNFFTQGRHNNITTVIALQEETALAPGIKKQAFVNIFTTRGAASAYFKRANTFDKKFVQKAEAAIEECFGGEDKWVKMAYLREGYKGDYFFKIKAPASVSDFTMCCLPVQFYGDYIMDKKIKGKSNKYMKLFDK